MKAFVARQLSATWRAAIQYIDSAYQAETSPVTESDASREDFIGLLPRLGSGSSSSSAAMAVGGDDEKLCCICQVRDASAKLGTTMNLARC